MSVVQGSALAYALCGYVQMYPFERAQAFVKEVCNTAWLSIREAYMHVCDKVRKLGVTESGKSFLDQFRWAMWTSKNDLPV
jgi:hypothetical protein